MKRREFVSVAGLAGVAALARPDMSATPLVRAPGATMVAGCQRAPTDARRLQHFKRHGVDHICGYPGNEDDPVSWSVESLTRLRELCPQLETVGFNGQTSGKFAPQFAQAGYRAVVLPSTSPAHASLTLAQKLELWRALL